MRKVSLDYEPSEVPFLQHLVKWRLLPWIGELSKMLKGHKLNKVTAVVSVTNELFLFFCLMHAPHIF